MKNSLSVVVIILWDGRETKIIFNRGHSKIQGTRWILEKFMLLTAVEQSECIGQYHAHLDPLTHLAQLDF